MGIRGNFGVCIAATWQPHMPQGIYYARMHGVGTRPRGVAQCSAPHAKMGWVKKGAGKVLTDGGSDIHAQYSTAQHSTVLTLPLGIFFGTAGRTRTLSL